MLDRSANNSLRRCLKSALALAAVLLLAQPGLAAMPNELGEETVAARFQLEYSWRGLAPVAPKEIFALMAAKNTDYRVVGRHNETGPQAGKTWSVDGALGYEYLQAVYDAIEEAEWTAVKEPAQVLDHTDDYPSTALRFISAKKQDVRLFTSSNTESGAPWNLQVGDKLYSTKSAAIGMAVYDLLDEIRKLPHKP